MFLPDPGSALWLSVQVALWCVVLGAPLAVALGWILARWSFPGKALLSTVVMVPLVLPPVVTGLLLLRAFGRASVLGGLLARVGLELPFTLAGAVVATLLVSLPLFVLVVRSAFETTDRRYEEVSLTLGVPPGRTFRRISLPLAVPGIAAGAVLMFARALGEFGASAVLSGNIEGQTRTLSMAVYTLLDAPAGEAQTGQLLYASLGLCFASLVGFEALSRWQKRRLEVDRGRR